MTVDEWLNTQYTHGLVYQEKTARSAWAAATTAERDRCAKICEKMMAETDQPYGDDENTHIDGWIAACNECRWAINEGAKT